MHSTYHQHSDAEVERLGRGVAYAGLLLKWRRALFSIGQPSVGRVQLHRHYVALLERQMGRRPGVVLLLRMGEDLTIVKVEVDSFVEIT